MDDEKYFTTGQLAQMAGITYKTIRIYIENNLLVPDKITEAGYKLFSMRGVDRLQTIMMFKYLDFSLEEIANMLDDENISESIDKQIDFINLRLTHLNQIKNALQEIQALPSGKNYNKMIEIMKLTSRKEEVLKQYIKTDNLEKRINIHDYSTSEVEWYDYLYDKCDIKAEMDILDVGCGNALFWYKIRKKLPKNLNIYLVDNSYSMIEAAKESHKKAADFFDSSNIKFYYFVCEAAEIDNLKELKMKKFHRIMANHMLYHLDNRDRKRFFEIVNMLMVDDGMFIASTIGENHMKEIFELAKQYNKNINEPIWFSKGFNLENGMEQLEEYFDRIRVFYHDNNLLVIDWTAIYEYLRSLPEIEKIMKKDEKKIKNFMREIVTKDKPFFIRKNTGLFISEKKTKRKSC